MQYPKITADEAFRIENIKANAMKYYEAMSRARAEGGNLADYIDPAGMDALRKITAYAGNNEEGPKDQPVIPTRGLTIVPTVTEIDKSGNARGYDIFSLLMKQRIVLLEGGVDDVMASIACASLLYLDYNRLTPRADGKLGPDGKPDDNIEVHINSPGGYVVSGLAIYDVMRSIKSKITTIGIGMQASMGSILLAAGDERKMTRNSWLMVHQISGGAQGQHSEMAIDVEHAARQHEQLKDIYVRHIGLTHEFWDVVLERNTWLTADQALKIGFINEIIMDDSGKKTAYEAESVRRDFNTAREKQVPKTAEAILVLLNNVSAAGAAAAAIRPELVTALAQYPRFWTEAKKKEVAAQKKAAVSNDNAPAAPPKKSNGPNQ